MFKGLMHLAQCTSISNIVRATLSVHTARISAFFAPVWTSGTLTRRTRRRTQNALVSVGAARCAIADYLLHQQLQGANDGVRGLEQDGF